jgi:hypothetical protein
MRALMSAIRVAFVTPTTDSATGNSTYELLALGKLDITATTDNSGLTTYTGGTISKTNVDDDTLTATLSLYNYTVTDNGSSVSTIKFGDKLTSSDGVATITSLTQNVAKKITVIVYLDGDLVDNTMVAAANSSMTGNLNLQFSSSATLQAMENTTMREGGSNSTITYTKFKDAGGTMTTTVGSTTYALTVNNGYAIYKGSDGNYYTCEVMEKEADQTYKKITASLLSGGSDAFTVTAYTKTTSADFVVSDNTYTLTPKTGYSLYTDKDGVLYYKADTGNDFTKVDSSNYNNETLFNTTAKTS